MFYLNNEIQLFGYNQDSKKVLNILTNLLKESLNIIHKDSELIFSWAINVEIINKKIIEIFKINSECMSAHLVILEAGENPNSNMDIISTCEQYYKDFDISNEMNIEIFCNETIFCRVLKFHYQKSQIKLLLGQWHINKEMCSTLLTNFFELRNL